MALIGLSLPAVFGLGPMELVILGTLCLGSIVAAVVILMVTLNRSPAHPRPWELENSGRPVVRCQNCQAENADNAKFCNQCGAALT
jgi:hypothetical protein